MLFPKIWLLAALFSSSFAQSNVEPDFLGTGHDENGAERQVIVRTRLIDPQAVFIQNPSENQQPAVSTPQDMISDEVPGQNPRQAGPFPPDNRFPNPPGPPPMSNRFPEQGVPFPPDNRFPSRQLENLRPPNNFPPPGPPQGSFPMPPQNPVAQGFPGRFPDSPRPVGGDPSQQRFVNPGDQPGQFFNDPARLPNKQLVIDSGSLTMGNAASQPGLPQQNSPPVAVENLPPPPANNPTSAMGTLGAGPIPEGMMTGIQLPASGPPIPVPMPPPPQNLLPPPPQNLQPPVQPMPMIVPGQRIPVVNGVPVFPGRQSDMPPGPPGPPGQDIPPANDNQNAIPIGQPDMGVTMTRMNEMTNGLMSTQQELMERINQQSGVIAFLMKSLVIDHPKTEEVAPVFVGTPPNNKPSPVSTGFL